ncbi:hypothetical protein L209DRAFT_588067 [Thermothelomyces heterothallicus CBS 203.75]
MRISCSRSSSTEYSVAGLFSIVAVLLPSLPLVFFFFFFFFLLCSFSSSLVISIHSSPAQPDSIRASSRSSSRDRATCRSYPPQSRRIRECIRAP